MKLESANWEWKIQGHVFSFASKPVLVDTKKNRIDTLFFREKNNIKWKKYLCKIKNNDLIEFTYNICCGGFYYDIINRPENVSNKIIFAQTAESNKKFLIEFGNSARILTYAKPDTLYDCWDYEGGMGKEYDMMRFFKVEDCTGKECKSVERCIKTRKKGTYNAEYRYEVLKKYFEIGYLPLDSGDIYIKFNPLTEEFTIK